MLKGATRVREASGEEAAIVLDETTWSQMWEALLAMAEHRKMTYEEFLAWADEDTLAEWIDGEIRMTSPASERHQDIADFLVSIIRSFVAQQNLGRLLSAPFQIKLEQGRKPDLLFVAREHLDRLKNTYLDGPADLVVEIISQDSIGRDRGAKFYEYERAGNPNIGYWTRSAVGPSSTIWNPVVTAPPSAARRANITPRCCPAFGCKWSGCGRNRCPPPYAPWPRS